MILRAVGSVFLATVVQLAAASNATAGAGSSSLSPKLPSQMPRAEIAAVEKRMTSELEKYLVHARWRRKEAGPITASARIDIYSAMVVVDVSRGFLDSVAPSHFGARAEEAARHLGMVVSEPHRERVELRGFHLTVEGRDLCELFPDMRNSIDPCPMRFPNAE